MKFSVTQLLVALAIACSGFAGCIFDAGVSFIIVLAALLYFYFATDADKKRKRFLYIVLMSLIVTGMGINLYTSIVFFYPDIPDHPGYFTSIVYPVPRVLWSAYDFQRQCMIPFGGGIGLALGYLFSRS